MIDRVCSLLKIKPPVPGASGLLFASGATVPTDGENGYQTGCVFQHTDGGAGTSLYVNEGSDTACSFQAVAALTAAQEALIGATAGTATASKAVILNAASHIDAVNTTALSIGASGSATPVTSTAAELNMLDLSAKTETVTEATKATGITAGSRIVKITGGTGFTGLVLPLPTAAELGMVKQITLDSISSSSVAITITNIAIHGTAATTATFDAAGETLVLIGAIFGTTYRWMVIAECGVTLS
jgi:hypothetical protein